MRRTPEQTAWVLIVIVKRSGQTRARISRATVRVASGRDTLRLAFLTALTDALADLGWLFEELASGGFGMVKISTLQAARPTTAKAWLTVDERRGLKDGSFDISDFRDEAKDDDEAQPDDD